MTRNLLDRIVVNAGKSLAKCDDVLTYDLKSLRSRTSYFLVIPPRMHLRTKCPILKSFLEQTQNEHQRYEESGAQVPEKIDYQVKDQGLPPGLNLM